MVFISFVFAVSLTADGLDAYNKGDYKKAVALWIKGCEEGVLKDCHGLGFMYHNGKSVKQDYEKEAISGCHCNIVCYSSFVCTKCI